MGVLDLIPRRVAVLLYIDHAYPNMELGRVQLLIWRPKSGLRRLGRAPERGWNWGSNQDQGEIFSFTADVAIPRQYTLDFSSADLKNALFYLGPILTNPAPRYPPMMC